MKNQNPFLLTGYLSPEYFCNREQETEILIEAARNPISTALFSIRRLGKTGLIHHVIHSLKKEKIISVYFDIMMTNSIHDFTYLFAKSFFNQSYNLTQKIFSKASQLFRSFSPSLTIDSMTGQLTLELKLIRSEEIYTDLENIFDYIRKSNAQYLIAIDEFQQILNYKEKNFEAFLRSKIQFINNVSFVFSGSKKNMLLSIFGSYSQPLWQSCNFMELKSIERQIYFDFIQNKLKNYNREITEEAFQFIYQSTRGITYYIQLICNYLFYMAAKRIDLESAKVALSKILKERESYYINYCSLLTSKQLAVLTGIAKEGSIDKPTGKDFIMSYKLGSASTVKSALDVLIGKEVVYQEEGKYFLTDVLFSEWLKLRAAYGKY